MSEQKTPSNFIRQIIDEDIKQGRVEKIVTRFPPEPNGYLHIGHAKSICLNFGLAEDYQGECHLRFDDTNPEKESQEYIDSIIDDVKWLGFKWQGDIRYTSDYFDSLYEWALHLIKQGDAYVCHLNAEQAREHRGTLTEPGVDSPHRSRSVDENLNLFEKMRSGECGEGECVLRAKIDMASPNMNMRDPILYRVRKASHHQTKDKWCIYPTYDFAHGQSDALEGISYSICTLEFEDHRPLYEWLLQKLPVPSTPKQYEFARLNVNYLVTSKRKLKLLVDEQIVSGWDDPRMPTIAGLRRRGYTASALRTFCDMIGVTRSDGVVDMAMLEFAIRDDLNENAPRAMCVLNPLKIVVTNFAELSSEPVQIMTSPVHPNKPELGERELPFTETLYIDKSDFTEDTTLSRKKFKRLVLGEFVRLRGAYVIKAETVHKDDAGNITQVDVTAIAGTVGDNPPEGMKPRGVIHWVSATEGKKAQVRIYDRLFNNESPEKGDDLMAHLTENSLQVLDDCWVEPSLATAAPEARFQFEREGYFVADRYDHNKNQLVFNQTIGLRDTWSNK